MPNVGESRVFRISFSDLLSWDFRSNYLNAINQCKWPTKSIDDIAGLRLDIALNEEISTGAVLLLDRISFDEGKIFAGSHTNTKMKQFKAYKGDVVISKINARKGAIGIVDFERPVGVTIHFRVLTPDKTKINTDFLKLALRSSYCRNQFEIGTGGQGKGEISESRLLDIKVPVPPILIQEKIVTSWKTLYNEVVTASRSFANLISELNQLLIQNTRSYRRSKNSRVFVASYSKAQKWDVKAGRSAAFRKANPKFVRLGDFTEECTELVRHWKEPEKEWPIYGVNNKEGVFLNTYQKGKDFNAPYKRIEKNWFFHNPTRANVGSLGIVPEVPEGAITSPEYQVWQLHSGFLSDFMALMIRTEYFLSLVDFNRVGGVKQRMYYTNLAEIRLPMIDLEIQKKFADQRVAILSSITEANETVKERESEIEEMILGLRPVEGI